MSDETRTDIRKFETPEEWEAYKNKILDDNTYRFGEFEFIWPTCQVRLKKDGRYIGLTETEADILRVLIEQWPIPMTGTELVRHLSVETTMAGTDGVKVFVRRIRNKLHGDIIITLRSGGGGYLFNPSVLLDPRRVQWSK